ncbi:MAG: ABC transporter ATP-binding protein [Blastocatellia bacterium]|nr:ABC transporter ATP-binding protein [Blastocatellia bacterium]
MSLLEVTNLQTHFFSREGVVPAVDDVSFSLGQGQALGLVGESGSGKSVTALSILGLVGGTGKVVGGSITYAGREITKLSEDEKRRLRGSEIAMIFQDPMTSLNPVFTVGEQIAEAIRTHRTVSKREAWNQAVEALKSVSIPDPTRRAGDYPHQMSGGMRQRAMIAMALSCNPKVLIADEPTTALDVTIQAQILALLRQLREERDLALLLITHDLGVVAETVDRVAVMYAGKIVEDAPVQALFQNPQHPYTQGLLASVPRLGQSQQTRLTTIEGVVPKLTALPPGCAFAPRCREAEPTCREAAIPMVTLTENPPHLVRCVRRSAD